MPLDQPEAVNASGSGGLVATPATASGSMTGSSTGTGTAATATVVAIHHIEKLEASLESLLAFKFYLTPQTPQRVVSGACCDPPSPRADLLRLR